LSGAQISTSCPRRNDSFEQVGMQIALDHIGSQFLKYSHGIIEIELANSVDCFRGDLAVWCIIDQPLLQ
jgi:hypothetical protein